MAHKKSEKITLKRNSSEVMGAVASSIDFIKSQIAIDLINAKSKNLIDLDHSDIKKLASIVESSITNSFIKASGQIESKL